MDKTTLVYKKHQEFVGYINDGFDKTSAYQKTYPGAKITSARTRSKVLIDKPHIKESLELSLRGAKITMSRVSSKFSSLLDAKKPLVVDGKIHDVEDNNIQLATATKCAELLGMAQAPGITVDNRSINVSLDGAGIETLNDVTHRLAEMSSEMLDSQNCEIIDIDSSVDILVEND